LKLNEILRRTNALRYEERKMLQAQRMLHDLLLITEEYGDFKEDAQELKKAYDEERRLFATSPMLLVVALIVDNDDTGGGG